MRATTDLLDELAGAKDPIKEGNPTRREVVKNHSNALCRTLGDRVRVRNARGELYPGGRV